MRARKPRFYVYQLTTQEGACAYIGKGSGRRLHNQKRSFALDGAEVARFWNERDCYQFERECIAERQPELNRHPGGNGSRARKKRLRREKWEIEIERIGSRRYSALILMKILHLVDPVHHETIRRVAYSEQAGINAV